MFQFVPVSAFRAAMDASNSSADRYVISSVKQRNRIDHLDGWLGLTMAGINEGWL
jgi:hypothetical protein